MPLYKQYDQASLNLQYNNRFHVPAYASHFSKWELLSRQAEKEYPSFKDIRYGSLPEESMDIYPAPQPGSRTLIFIHGGYWQSMDKSSFQFIAAAFMPYGITTIIINYPLAPVFSMDQMVISCNKINQWLPVHLSAYNGDSNQVYIAGYSAGGHLGAMLMKANAESPDSPAYKGLCALSGLFNLIPVQLSNLNNIIGMDPAAALRNSPALLPAAGAGPFLLAVGEDETAEFKEQSREMHDHLETAGKQVQLLEMQGLNHFSIVEAFADKGSLLQQAMLRLTGI